MIPPFSNESHRPSNRCLYHGPFTRTSSGGSPTATKIIAKHPTRRPSLTISLAAAEEAHLHGSSDDHNDSSDHSNTKTTKVPALNDTATSRSCDLTGYTKKLDRKQIEKELRGIETYSEFKRAAKHRGHLINFEAWRTDDRPGACEYDVLLLKRRLHAIEKARCSRDPEKMLRLINTHLSRFVAGVDNETLFHPFLHGTKRLIEDYADSVCGLLNDFARICRRSIIKADKVRYAKVLELTRLTFGRTGLFCSGGGTLGMRHIGTIKTLFENGLLPQVVCGSSSGSIVCAVLCSKSDDDLQKVLESFCHGDLKVFVGDREQQQGMMFRLAYILTHLHLYDSENLKRVMKFHLGETTFAEAYELTGRTLNITVTTEDPVENSGLLNYRTAPNVLLWSAVVASCALPTIYSRATIHTKDPVTGKIETFNHGGASFADGSISGDIPFEAIHDSFDVNHSIVAQVNPHVVPFLEDKSAAERRWKPTWAIFVDCVKEEASLLLSPWPRIRSLVAQKYTGHITILPKDWARDFGKVLANPTAEFMEDAKCKGERATCERMSIIENHMKIERALEAAATAAREAVYECV